MSSMAAQIAGRKRWMLCAADQAEYLYNAGDVDTSIQYVGPVSQGTRTLWGHSRV